MNSPEVKALIEAAQEMINWFDSEDMQEGLLEYFNLQSAIEAVKKEGGE